MHTQVLTKGHTRTHRGSFRQQITNVTTVFVSHRHVFVDSLRPLCFLMVGQSPALLVGSDYLSGGDLFL